MLDVRSVTLTANEDAPGGTTESPSVADHPLHISGHRRYVPVSTESYIPFADHLLCVAHFWISRCPIPTPFPYPPYPPGTIDLHSATAHSSRRHPSLTECQSARPPAAYTTSATYQPGPSSAMRTVPPYPPLCSNRRPTGSLTPRSCGNYPPGLGIASI